VTCIAGNVNAVLRVVGYVKNGAAVLGSNADDDDRRPAERAVSDRAGAGQGRQSGQRDGDVFGAV
jgi:hypothetical protein